jgi:transcriptional regulator with XRE-family HTH domain
MPITLEHAFGRILLQERQGAGLSQEELAHQAGLHVNAVSLLERGKRSPSLETVFRIAIALKKRPAELVAEVESLFPVERIDLMGNFEP